MYYLVPMHMNPLLSRLAQLHGRGAKQGIMCRAVTIRLSSRICASGTPKRKLTGRDISSGNYTQTRPPQAWRRPPNPASLPHRLLATRCDRGRLPPRSHPFKD